MNVAILTAGGTGTRMHLDVPKQFLEIEGKPLIVYTMERFEKCELIDCIVVTCLDGWQDEMWRLVKKYNLSKVKHIVKGGATGQESIYNGFSVIKENYDENTIVLIHDGNRPLVSNEIIEASIKTCNEKGNAVAYIPCQEVMFVSDDMKSSSVQIDRSKLARTQTPHVYRAKDMNDIYDLAKKEGLENCVAMCSMCALLGIETYLYPGSEKNIKITTPVDIDIFRAILKREGKQ